MLRQRIQEDKASMMEDSLYLTNTPVIDTDKFQGPDRILKFIKANPEKYQKKGSSLVKTREMMMDYTKFQHKELSAESISQLQGTEYQAAYVQGMTESVLRNMQGVGTSKTKQTRDAQRAEVEVSYKKAVDALDEREATAQIDDNVKLGIWTEPEGAKRLMELGSQIDFGVASKMSMSQDGFGLTDAMDFIYGQPNRMTAVQRSQLGSRVDSKQRQLTTKYEAEAKVRKIERSDQERLGASDFLYMRGGQPWEVVRDLTLSMDPQDAQSVYALNRSLLSSEKATGLKSHPKAENRLNAQVYSLAAPEPGMSYSEQKRLVMADITDAVNLGPSSGGITGEDGIAMRKRVDEMADIGVKNVQYREAENFIYKSITGAGKDSMGLFDQSGPTMIAALEMDSAMFDASREAGAGFDPMTWAKRYVSKYASIAYSHNKSALDRERVQAVVVRAPAVAYDGSSWKIIDGEATREKIRERISNGTLSRAEADVMINTIREMDRLERIDKLTGDS